MRAGLLAEPAFWRGLVRGGAGGADRRQQLLRLAVAAAISLFGLNSEPRWPPWSVCWSRCGHAFGGYLGRVARLVRGRRRQFRGRQEGSASMSVTIYHNPACGTSRTRCDDPAKRRAPEVFEY